MRRETEDRLLGWFALVFFVTTSLYIAYLSISSQNFQLLAFIPFLFLLFFSVSAFLGIDLKYHSSD